MLTIRRAQMQTFEKAALGPFENEMVTHSRMFSPRLSQVLEEDGLRVALRGAMEKALGYGFTNRGPMRLVIEMMFLYGSGFDTDPQYPWAREILESRGEQMQRAETLRDQVLGYQKSVSGHEAVNTRNALAALLAMTKEPLPFAANDFSSAMPGELRRIFPQKAAYVGETALTALVRKGAALADHHDFRSARGEAMLVALMFAFGHGCANDLLYPWIAQTLSDERIVDATARADRLEKKAVTWLEHVLARPKEEPSV